MLIFELLIKILIAATLIISSDNVTTADVYRTVPMNEEIIFFIAKFHVIVIKLVDMVKQTHLNIASTILTDTLLLHVLALLALLTGLIVA